jgi:Putative phage serine protease XkdF
MDNDMLINKASWTTDKENLRLSMPIGKVDAERRIVSGFASLDNIDKQDDIVTAEASVKAFKNFKGNLREMHQPSAVGKMVSFKEDRYFDPNSKKFYNGVYVSAYVSKGAQDAWEKVLDGTYSGFSIGGNIKSWDDAYNADLDKAIRVIKDYELFELSLVDSPANQFASIISVEKVDGKDVVTGSSADTVIENVFYDSENGIVLVSDSETAESPISGKGMENIGFVEKNDDEKTNMIKFLVDSAKGISTIKITKEVSQMTEATEVAVDAAVENVEITPEAQPAEVETPAVVEETPAEVAVEKSDDGGAVPSAPVVEEESVTPEVEAEPAVAKSDEAVADAVAEIKNSLTNAFGDLATTIKSLHEQVAALSKSIDGVSAEVNNVKGEFNEFGKRVDAVEQDTAFRKSGDLGEIVQFEPEKVQKSLWGGRFLKNSDLFN